MLKNKVRIAVAQLEIIAGRPDLNTKKIISEIVKAKEKKVDIVVFSEMAVSGYLLGDEWENDAFVHDLTLYNEEILKATIGITAIWGNVFTENSKKGEDGRVRKYNSVFVASDGNWVSNGVFDGHTFKTLMPKYREFDDERHFYSMLKLANERKTSLDSLLKPFQVKTHDGTVKIGAILCEDMWSDDYADKPTEILVKNGAEMIVNLSCSPWTWRKNNKRHRVVEGLLDKNPVHFIYCNNTGIQNNGKNVFLFDGNSTVYNPDGSLMAVASDYQEQTLYLTVVPEKTVSVQYPDLSDEQDTKELYEGLVYGLQKFFENLPSKEVVIGLSGGIDSAVVTCLLAKALGKENVYAVNMPSIYNSSLTKDAALNLAKNLKINYAVFPIQDSYDLTIKEMESLDFNSFENGSVTKIELSGVNKENIQARDRGARVLAGIASGLGAVFTNNGNKTETTIGWCTLYGDVNGAIAPIADIYKGEVYQLAEYINKVSDTVLIPKEIIGVVPSAELSENHDVTKGLGDPINYPYHDKLFRAFVEFRKDPEQILELYLDGKLEEELKVPKGTVEKYFPTTESFIADLEHKWRAYKINIFKRIQAPPIIAVSRRAFGFDLRESQNGAYFTRRYIQMKEANLSRVV